MLDQPEAFALVVIDFLGDGMTATINRPKS